MTLFNGHSHFQEKKHKKREQCIMQELGSKNTSMPRQRITSLSMQWEPSRPSTIKLCTVPSEVTIR